MARSTVIFDLVRSPIECNLQRERCCRFRVNARQATDRQAVHVQVYSIHIVRVPTACARIHLN